MTTYCDVNTCEECPRYGDDCDGDKRVEHTDLISRADAIAYIDRVIKSGLGRYKSLNYIRKYISALPSADAEPTMTEEVREALMRLTMCAREECGMCKYKDECGFEFQYNIATENMNTILDALSADAVHGEWEFVDNEIFAGEYFCSICGKRAEVDLYGEWILSNFCPSCGARMKGGAE